MIRLLRNMPAGVLGLEAVDDVEKQDYERVVVPAIEATLAEHDQGDRRGATRRNGVGQ
jgi:hypothetical protein